MELEMNDIVIANNKIQQYLGEYSDSGAILQDKHTFENVIHRGLIERKANRDEVKWFCENTEKIDFVAPNRVNRLSS